MSVTLGIDIGTSGTKTLAIDERGTILASATAEYPCDHPRPGWSEQDPEHWWRATAETVRGVLRKGNLRPADVKGVSEIAASDVATALKFCKTAAASSRRAMYELGRAYAASQKMAEPAARPTAIFQSTPTVGLLLHVSIWERAARLTPDACARSSRERPRALRR